MKNLLSLFAFLLVTSFIYGQQNNLIRFYPQNSLTLAQAKNIAQERNWKLVSPSEVEYAWKNLGLDVYAYGMMNNGQFAVPIQTDRPNIKKGHNIGIRGGNQGFFYTTKIQVVSDPSKAKIVKFHSQANMSLYAAQALARSNNWVMASESDVLNAWTHHNLNVYAYGMMANGQFAVPIQTDRPNIKKGANIGIQGGNQGFFYTDPESVTWGFYNDGAFPIEVSINGKTIGTLQVSQRTQYLPVTYGDELSFSTLEENQVNNRRKLGFPTAFITKGTQNPLRIEPREAYYVDDVRKGLTYDYQASLHGIDLTRFNPADVGGSFKTTGQLFDGLRDGTYEYSQQGDGTYIPKGFWNTGDISSGSGNFKEQTIIGRDKVKEAFTVGAKASVAIPVPKKPIPSTTVTPELGFSYGDSKIENSSETDIFITTMERKLAYNLELISLSDVVLTRDFKRSVEKINSLRDAREVVERFGTHFTDNVYYGGQYHSLVRIHENTFYKANEQRFGLDASVSVDEVGTQTKEKIRNKEHTTGSTDPSSLFKGSLSFGYERNESNEEIYGDIDSEYWYIGGKGNIDNWEADNDNAVAVRVGKLFYISDLVKPEIFKTAMSEAELAPRRALLRQAIEYKLNGMNYLPKPTPYRSFQYRIKSIDYIIGSADDANTRVKGALMADIISNGRKVESQTLWEKREWSEENRGGLTNRKGFKLPKKNRWQTVRQKGRYVGSGVDLNMQFPPLKLRFWGTITDKDDDGRHDTMKIVGNPTMNITNSRKIQEFTYELSHFISLPERMKVKVTIEVVPLVGF